jgi:hypothetical protein
MVEAAHACSRLTEQGNQMQHRVGRISCAGTTAKRSKQAWAVWAVALCIAGAGCSDDAKPNNAADGGDAAMGDGNDGGAVHGGSGSSGKSGGGSSGTNGGGHGGTSGAGTATDGGPSDAPEDAGAIVVPDALQLCGGPCACGDGIDNDMDGTIDGFDTECTGPGDDDEGSFSTGIPGDNRDPKWQDCFFDGNSGAGDDGCRYSTKCLTGELDQDDKDCTLAQACVDFCRPRTPNGCDCFGCCEIYKPDGSSVHVMLSASCDDDHLDDCQTCTPSDTCSNDCGECELCAGKTLADLPASCSMTGSGGSGGNGGGGNSGNGGNGGDGAGGTGSGGTGNDTGLRCNDHEALCLSNADCDDAHYCSFGCCVLAGPD